MFSQQKTVLWIRQQELIVTRVTEKGVAEHQESFAWNIQSLDTTLHAIKDKYKNTVTILIDPSFSYTVDIPTPPNSNKNDIQKIAEKWIPEKFDDIPWSYVMTNEKLSVTAMTSLFANHLIEALHKTNFGKVSVVSVEQLRLSPDDTGTDITSAHWKRFIQLLEDDNNLINIGSKEKNISPEKSLKSPRSSRTPRILYLIIALLISAIIFVSFLLWKIETGKEKRVVTPSSTKTGQSQETSIIIASPSPSKQNIQIQILNGTGVAGAAADIEELLDEEGFKVVDTGNAERFDYEATEIQAKLTVPTSVIEELDNILGDNYSVIRGSTIESASEIDIIIITGTQK